jgi:hypothetical protein
MTHPDFIIIGAMKCGTSTLAAQLGAQEGVFMTSPKEPNFFSDDDVFAQGQGWYDALFEPAVAGDLKGEASTHYTKLPTYPETLARLQATGATPKLIYMLREPIDRLVSHYIHEWTQGIMSDSLEESIKAHPELRSYSRYGEQLVPWVEAFGAENILVLSMQDLKQNPQELLCTAGAFLGKPDVAWTDDLGQMNVSAERIRKLPLHGLIFDNPVAEWLRRTLVPQALRDFIKSKRQMQTRPELSDATRAALVTEFNADRARLLKLFPDRPELESLYPQVGEPRA